MSHNDPPIVIVNEDDKPVGVATKKEAQQQNLIHRIAQVMVEDGNGRILLQKRADDSELYPGRWDMSVGGHVDEGEDYLGAAKREMFEEIGLQDVELRELGKYRKNSLFEWRHLNRFYMIFRAVVPDGTVFQPDPAEVSEVRWFTVDEVKQASTQHPDQFTFSVPEALTRFYS